MTTEANLGTGKGKNFAYRMAAAIVKPLMFLVSTRDWRGAENLPSRGGYVAAANHMTNLDPLTFAHYLYNNSTGRPPRILAKASLWKVPVLNRILNSTGMIPVHRNSAGAASSLADAVEQLRAGECIAVFPEGTLTRDPDLWPMVGKTGAARLALASGVPVVPVAQWGPQIILPQHSKRPRLFPRTKVSVYAGPPVDLSDLRGKPQDASVLTEATDRIMAAITALLEEIRGKQAPTQRFDARAAAREQRAREAANGAVSTPELAASGGVDLTGGATENADPTGETA